MRDPVVTGIGVTASLGQGKEPFIKALLAGRQAFSVLRRPGRQRGSSFLGAEIPPLAFPERFTKRLLRTLSFTGQVALVTLQEAWDEAGLAGVDPERIGLVIGGSNLQQRELWQTVERYRDSPEFLPPSYGLSFMDSDLCGLLSESFGIRGFAVTAGGASGSGQLAILQAIQALETGQVDACIALGALMDLSFWECQGFRALGAMGSDRYADDPAHACRPFDRGHDGFIYGECCGALVLEPRAAAGARGALPYARLSGWGMTLDGNRQPDPSCQGEERAIAAALARAGLCPDEIDYLNPHGTGSALGDGIELRALRGSGLGHARINATKSLVGHGLSAAGTVEVIATLLQMKAGRLHPTLNLEDPIDPEWNWVLRESVPHQIRHALSLSMGFGGINTALIMNAISN